MYKKGKKLYNNIDSKYEENKTNGRSEIKFKRRY